MGPGITSVENPKNQGFPRTVITQITNIRVTSIAQAVEIKGVSDSRGCDLASTSKLTETQPASVINLNQPASCWTLSLAETKSQLQELTVKHESIQYTVTVLPNISEQFSESAKRPTLPIAVITNMIQVFRVNWFRVNKAAVTENLVGITEESDNRPERLNVFRC